jgi:hypothetical protein
MMHIQSDGTARLLQSMVALFLGAALTACASPSGRAQAVQESAPSVTYKYTDDEGLVDATIKAEAYCREYNAWPTQAGMRVEADGAGASQVTFVCDAPRAAASAALQSSPNVTVNYSYRDEQALVDATMRAQRHCGELGAVARSSTVSTEADGSRTIVFECIHMR